MKRLLLPLGMASLFALPLAGQAASYQEMPLTEGGRITGTVNFAGKDTPPKVYRITKDNEACGTGTVEIDYVRVNNGKLMETVVYLDKVKAGKPFPADIDQVQIDQERCRFGPLLRVMRNDTRLTTTNQDNVLHNVHTYEMLGRVKKTVFNLSQPNRGDINKSSIKLRRGDAMKVECDAHDFMHAFVFVAKNPYYALVGEAGRFNIDNVPPGDYTIKAWHGTLKGKKGKIKISANNTSTFDFTFE